MPKAQKIECLKQPLGINSVASPANLTPNELTKALNVKLNDFGELVTREGVTLITSSSAPSSITTLKHIPVGSDVKLFAVDSSYNIYCCSGTSPNLGFGSALATLEGKAQLISFNDYCIICDGSYLKKSQGTDVTLCYDDGTNIGGYHLYDLDTGIETEYELDNTVVDGIGTKYTTDSWGSLTMPLLSIDVWLSKTGTPTGSITAKLYSSSYVLLATSEAITATTFSTNPSLYNLAFDGTYNLTSGTEYVILLYYTNGTATDHVSVYGTVTTGANTWLLKTGPVWEQLSTFDLSLGVKPGLPPKAKFGAVNNLRLWLAGNEDQPGRLSFSNVNTPLDWSTLPHILANGEWADIGGGWIGAVDSSSHAYEVGAIVPLFNDLYIFGTDNQPYLSKLTGTTPNDFALPPTYQQTSAESTTAIPLLNDIWFASKKSVHNLKGVQQYGDIRTYSPGDPIKDKIQTYFDSDAFSGFNPKDGQYLIKLTGYDNILVCHTASPVSMEGTPIPRYAWTEYKLKDLTPTSFDNYNTIFYIGCSDGNIYKLDNTVIKDVATLPDIEVQTGVLDFDFGSIHTRKIAFNILSDSEASCTCSFYKNKNSTSFWDRSMSIDATSIESTVCFVANSLQFYLCDFTYTEEVSFKDLFLYTYQMRSR